LRRSDKRNILQWLVQAKRIETHQKRINEIAELADKNQNNLKDRKSVHK